MKRLEQQVKDAIDSSEEFELLDDISIYCNGHVATLSDVNYCLDVYNWLIKEQDKYMAKYNAISKTVYRITNDN